MGLPVLTWEQLSSLLRMRGTPIIKINGVPHILNSVEREDGSGRKFNLTCSDAKTRVKKTIFVTVN